MPLQKILFKPGVNKENTRYTTEGGWYECDKVRFRQGNPEVIGGWQRISGYTYNGICRSLWNWVTLQNQNLVGVGTNTKFYIEQGGAYNDITPLRSYTESPVTLTNPFDTTSGSAVINVNDTAHGLTTGDVALFSGAVAVGGISAELLNTNHVVTVIGVDDYTITVPTTATSTVTGGGGTVTATYTKYNVTLTNPFTATLGSAVITVAATAHGATTGSFVTFTGATGLGGNVTTAILNLSTGYQVTVINANSYTITVSVNANATDVSGSPGGGTLKAAYQLNAGPAFAVPLTGWGAGAWGAGTWGYGGAPISSLQLWSQMNFGQDLLFGPRGGGIYYWDATTSVTTRGVNLTTLGDAETPVVQNSLTVSDASRFVIVFGTNDPNATNPTAIDPMFIRWSDQEDPFTWIPAVTNQAGSLRLSHGSEIITTVQTRQEIVVFTDSAIYSLQYLGPPFVWGSQLLGDNISIISPNAAVIASGVVYWMGVDKFYAYDGRVQTLNCDLRRFIFQDLNLEQTEQVFCGTNEGFNEAWWFYPSAGSTLIDKYVVYNYLEKIWYYGTMERSAWLDSGLRGFPLAAVYDPSTSTGNLVNHESGLNNNETGTTIAIDAYISSSEFDIGDGHNFGFIWRVLPDLTFEDSTNTPTGSVPSVTMTLYGLANSGSGVTSTAAQPVAKSSTYVITEEFTGQIYTRLRGRQMIFKIGSNQINTAWQLGAPRIDIRPDGRR
jgi:hypothetical protein